MDIESLIQKVWKHSGVQGHVWMPHIVNIGKPGQKFAEGKPLDSRAPAVPDLRDSVDWYWTPAVSKSESRKAKEYPAQRVLWVDCDESYDDAMLTALKPSYVWETSPGHKQAVWLMKDRIPASEYHRDGLMGMLTQALGGDKSGVDIGQLLRVPGTVHHKGKPFRGKVLRTAGNVYTRGQVLTRVARALGFSAGLASELGADDPYGDRSKVLWRFARNAAELGLPQDLAFKLIKACKWNKWADDPDRLKEDIARAYEHQPDQTSTPTEQHQEAEQHVAHDDDVVAAWDMATVDEFGQVLRTPIRWVVPGIIPEGGCGLLIAAPKVGKTRIAIELALGVATGRKPLGLTVSKPQPVGFLSLEDGERLFSDRLNASLNRDQGRFKHHWDGHIREVAGGLVWEPPAPLGLHTRFASIDLKDALDKQRLHETVVKYGLKFVIIDTLSMAIGNSDVSNSTDMNAILKDVRTVARATGCAIMFIHHTRKRQFESGESIQERVLGSTALHAWCDFIMSLAEPEEDSEMLRLGVQTKMGNNQHYISPTLKIIKRTDIQEDS